MSYPLRSCHRCGKDFFSSYEEHICQDCLKDLGWEPTPCTNAQHIRSMTDEELTDFLCDATYKENEQGYPIMRTVNKVWWRKWLRQPYEEAAE